MLPSLAASPILPIPLSLPFLFPPKLRKSSLRTTTSASAASTSASPAPAAAAAADDKAVALHRFLASYGFTGPQVACAVAKIPDLVVANRDRTLKPKLEFLLGDLGFSPKAIAVSPYVFRVSLEGRLRPNLAVLADLLGSPEAAAAAARKSPRLLYTDLRKHLLPKLETLRQCGVSVEHDVVRLGSWYLTVLLVCTPEQLARTIEHLKDTGLDPSSRTFVRAVATLSFFKTSTLEKKMDFYRGMGWTDEEITTAMRKFPNFLQMSDEKTKRVLEFFREELGWGPEVLTANPSILGMSFEKRLVPRVAVWRVLQAKGLVSRGARPIDLRIGKERFWDKYVAKHGQEYPEVLHAYRGAVEIVREDDEDLI